MIYEIALVAGGVITTCWGGPPVVQKLRRVRLPSINLPAVKALSSSKEELFPGATKPTTTLARMIVIELLKDAFVPLNRIYEHPKFTVRWEIGKPEVPFKVKPTTAQCEEARRAEGSSSLWKNEFKTPGNHYYENYSVPYARRQAERKQEDTVINVSVTGLNCGFDEDEIKIIQAGLVEALRLHGERLVNKKKFENQQKAVDALAQWVGIEKKEEEQKPCPPTNEKPKSTRPKRAAVVSLEPVLNPEDSM